MVLKKAVREMCKESKVKLYEVVERLGYSRPSSLNTMTQRGDMRVSVLAKVADICGYDLVLRPKKLGLKDADNGIILLSFEGLEEKKKSEKGESADGE